MILPNRKQKSDWWTWGIISLLYKLDCSREISTIEKKYLHTRKITDKPYKNNNVKVFCYVPNACTDKKKLSFISYCYCKQPPLHIDHKSYKVAGWERSYTGGNSSSVYRYICVFEYVFFMWLNVI